MLINLRSRHLYFWTNGLLDVWSDRLYDKYLVLKVMLLPEPGVIGIAKIQLILQRGGLWLKQWMLHHRNVELEGIGEVVEFKPNLIHKDYSRMARTFTLNDLKYLIAHIDRGVY